MSSTPLELFMKEFVPHSKVEAIEAEVAKIQKLPSVRKLGQMKTPVYGNDPNELIQSRFLYRGAMVIMCGPTGVGKSSLGMQLAIHMSVGRTLFGLVPGEVYQAKGMRVLIVQAENDEGDLAEMRDGVLAGCEDLTGEEKALALDRVDVVTINDKSGDEFAAHLEAILTECGPYDLVIVDPAFAYLGGDSNSQRDVSHFMRELMNPLVQRHQVGLILTHHTNKPMRGKEKENWEAGDYAYLGAGSAEWVNPARGALALRSVGSDTVFEFRAPKRGKRLKWKDAEGNGTTVQFIAHSVEIGKIYWRLATHEEIAELEKAAKGGRPKKCELEEVLHCIQANEQENQKFYLKAVSDVLGCSETVVQEAIAKGVKQNLIRAKEAGKERRYLLTEKGRKMAQNRPSNHCWSNHEPDDGL